MFLNSCILCFSEYSEYSYRAFRKKNLQTLDGRGMSDYKTLKTLIQEAGILELKKPDDYPMVMRVDRYAVEKPTAQLVIKAHWLEPKNPDKPNVVYLGHQIFDTYWYNGKTFPTVAHAMIFKWNSIVNRTWKCDLYDNRDFPG